jgi:hypothetical protein
MKLHHVPARTGWLWVQLGIRTFFRQPLALAGLFFLFMMAVSLVTVVPWVGTALALSLLPAATLGLMAATREAASGHFPMPAILASALRAGKERRKAMLVLGGLYALGSFLIMAISSWLAGGDPGPLSATEDILQEPAFLMEMLISMVLYTPLGLLFWHAPALVHWHNVPPIKSLFFSLLACWTNKAALLVYCLAWGGVFIAVAFVVVVLGQLIGSRDALNIIMFPVAMLLSSMFFTSLYFTFHDSFLTDDDQPPA